MVQRFDQQMTGLVVADHAHGQHVHTQRRQVHDGVAASAGHHRALAMLQDEHRRLPRDAGDLAENELIGNQVTEHRDGEVRKGLNDLLPAVVIFGVSSHGLAVSTWSLAFGNSHPCPAVILSEKLSDESKDPCGNESLF